MDYPKNAPRTHLKNAFKDLALPMLTAVAQWMDRVWSEDAKTITPLLPANQRTKSSWMLAVLEAVNDIENGKAEASSTLVPGLKGLLKKYENKKRTLYGALELLYWWEIGLVGGSTASEVRIEAANAGLTPRSVCDTLIEFETLRQGIHGGVERRSTSAASNEELQIQESTNSSTKSDRFIGSGEESSPDELAMFNEATAALALDDLNTAENLLQELVRQHKNPRYLYNLGYIHYRRARYADALAAYTRVIKLEPRMIDAYLNAFKTCLMTRDHSGARRFVEAATKIAPERVDVRKARAQYFDAIGDRQQYWSEIAKLPNEMIFKRPVDNDVKRLKENASVLIGERRVSVWMAIFAGEGLRTVFVGYKDPKSALSRPTVEYKWTPLQADAEKRIHVESLDESNDEVAMLGYRLAGMDEPVTETALLGHFEAHFHFENLEDLSPDSYGGLFIAGHGILLQPKQLFVRDLLSVSEGDLWDVRDDMLQPHKDEPVTNNPYVAKVFLCYAREDLERVTLIHRGLVNHGIDSYMDKDLKVGEPYEKVLRKRIQQSDFAIVFVSSQSTTKTGFVNVELRLILKESERRQLGGTFILPVKLDLCEVPDEIGAFHWLEPSDDHTTTINALVTSIQTHFSKRRTK